MVLDIGSHWFQMKQAGEGEHHKKGNRNPIVKVRAQGFLLVLCCHHRTLSYRPHVCRYVYAYWLWVCV